MTYSIILDTDGKPFAFVEVNEKVKEVVFCDKTTFEGDLVNKRILKVEHEHDMSDGDLPLAKSYVSGHRTFYMIPPPRPKKFYSIDEIVKNKT